MDANVKPLAKHAAGSRLRPLRGVGRPAGEPVIKEEGELLIDERLNLVNGIAIGTEKDR